MDKTWTLFLTHQYHEIRDGFRKSRYFKVTLETADGSPVPHSWRCHCLELWQCVYFGFKLSFERQCQTQPIQASFTTVPEAHCGVFRVMHCTNRQWLTEQTVSNFRKLRHCQVIKNRLQHVDHICRWCIACLLYHSGVAVRSTLKPTMKNKWKNLHTVHLKQTLNWSKESMMIPFTKFE